MGEGQLSSEIRMEQMWARLWGRRAGGSKRGEAPGGRFSAGEGTSSTGGGWKKINERMKNFLNKIKGEKPLVSASDIHDNINYSIDSGIGSESSSICLDQCEEITENKYDNHGCDSIVIGHKNPMKLLPSIQRPLIQPSVVSSHRSLILCPSQPPVSIIKPLAQGKGGIKKSISFCEHTSSRRVRVPLKRRGSIRVTHNNQIAQRGNVSVQVQTLNEETVRNVLHFLPGVS